MPRTIRRRETLCNGCGHGLTDADVSREGYEAVEHGVALCSECRTCSDCGQPTMTDELLRAGWTSCGCDEVDRCA
jgi:hypothetical protein